MSIASRISAIEEHLEDDYSVLELAGADLTNVDKNIINLKPTWKERLLYFMNNGTDVVWDNWDKVEEEGTSLTLNNTLEAKMKIELKGNTYQNGTPTPDAPIDIQVVSGDNTIKVEGKNLFDEEYPNILSSDTLRYRAIYVGEGAFTMSSNIPLTPVNRFANIFFLSGNVSSGASTGGNGVYVNRPITQTSENGYVTIAYRNYENISPLNYNTMLEKGSSATDYVAYQSQSYPINLPVENLFDKDSITSGYRISSSGDNFVASDYYVSSFIKVNFNTTYTKNSPTADAYHRVAFYQSNSISSFISVKDDNNTFTTPANCQYIRFCGLQTELDTTILTIGNHIQTISDTPIELCKIGDYQDKIAKSTGKNKLNNSAIVKGRLDNGVIGYESNTTALTTTFNSISFTTNANYRGVVSDFIPIEEGTFIVFSWSNATTTPVIQINYYDENKSYISANSGFSLTNALRYSNSIANAKYVRFYINLNTAGTQTITNPQVRFYDGDVPDYEPYGTGWYLNKQIGKYYFTSSTNFFINNNCFQSSSDITSNIDLAFTNKYTFNPVHQQITQNLLNYQFGFNTTGKLSIRDDRFTTLTEFGNDLRENPLYFYYVLNTPTYTEITDSTLLSQLNALGNANSYNNQTNINQDNNDLASILNASALENI